MFSMSGSLWMGCSGSVLIGPLSSLSFSSTSSSVSSESDFKGVSLYRQMPSSV